MSVSVANVAHSVIFLLCDPQDLKITIDTVFNIAQFTERCTRRESAIIIKP